MNTNSISSSSTTAQAAPSQQVLSQSTNSQQQNTNYHQNPLPARNINSYQQNQNLPNLQNRARYRRLDTRMSSTQERNRIATLLPSFARLSDKHKKCLKLALCHSFDLEQFLSAEGVAETALEARRIAVAEPGAGLQFFLVLLVLTRCARAPPGGENFSSLLKEFHSAGSGGVAGGVSGGVSGVSGGVVRAESALAQRVADWTTTCEAGGLRDLLQVLTARPTGFNNNSNSSYSGNYFTAGLNSNFASSGLHSTSRSLLSSPVNSELNKFGTVAYRQLLAALAVAGQGDASGFGAEPWYLTVATQNQFLATPQVEGGSSASINNNNSGGSGSSSGGGGGNYSVGNRSNGARSSAFNGGQNYKKEKSAGKNSHYSGKMESNVLSQDTTSDVRQASPEKTNSAHHSSSSQSGSPENHRRQSASHQSASRGQVVAPNSNSTTYYPTAVGQIDRSIRGAYFSEREFIAVRTAVSVLADFEHEPDADTVYYGYLVRRAAAFFSDDFSVAVVRLACVCGCIDEEAEVWAFRKACVEFMERTRLGSD